MLTEQITIPAALQIVIDDVGWMIGNDMRWEDEPSRTGIPRRHVLADYQMLEELGKSLDMKLLCPFVIGEWDRNNILRRLPDASKFGRDWDSALYLRSDEAATFRDFLNQVEHIEIALHGLLHDRWHDGKLVGPREFYVPEGNIKNAPETLAPENVIKAHLDAFFEIYDTWGFNQTIRSFASPSGSYGDSWKTDNLARILSEYGIKYWCNTGFDECLVRNGIIINKKDITLAPWEAYDLDPTAMSDFDPGQAGIVGGHWPNFLKFNPAKNLDNLPSWTEFFRRQGELFGIILAKDFSFASHQQLYKNMAELHFADGLCVIDLGKVDNQGAAEMPQPIYISVKKGLAPKFCTGGLLEIYEYHREFCHYRIRRTKETIIKISLRPDDNTTSRKVHPARESVEQS
ncbi:MAG: hypothetical protein SCM11_16880 [Bacillota bacterium]|nr:hypothetical protein [Bacillota bacterium]